MPVVTEAQRTVGQLRQFFNTILKLTIMMRSGAIGPGHTPVNPTDTGLHPVFDSNAETIAHRLSFRNRIGNAGNLAIGDRADQFILLVPGQSATMEMTYLAEWYYKVVGGAATDGYEIWWT